MTDISLNGMVVHTSPVGFWGVEPLFIEPFGILAGILLAFPLVFVPFIVWWDATRLGMYRPMAWALVFPVALLGGLEVPGLGPGAWLLVLCLYVVVRHRPDNR